MILSCLNTKLQIRFYIRAKLVLVKTKTTQTKSNRNLILLFVSQNNKIKRKSATQRAIKKAQLITCFLMQTLRNRFANSTIAKKSLFFFLFFFQNHIKIETPFLLELQMIAKLPKQANVFLHCAILIAKYPSYFPSSSSSFSLNLANIFYWILHLFD